jgi:tetratricopeptide (TPR) repeat protein
MGGQLPGGAGSRPNVGGAGGRPEIGSRPAQLPAGGSRPGAGTRPGGERPAQLPGLGNRPGVGAGIGAGLGAAAGIGISDRMNMRGDRNNWGQGQRDKMNNWQNQLSDRMHNPQDSGRWEDARDNWQNNHQDWHDWHDNWHNHDHWHHGCWPGYYGGWWHNMWNNYPLASALGVTAWGLNSLSYQSGYSDYSNPYYESGGGAPVYDYSEPIVASEPPPADGQPKLSPEQEEALKKFDQAREVFKAKRYDEALTLTDQALKVMPKDAIMHEFRAVTLMCLGKYRDSAAALYAVLAVTPGMDWTTLSSLFVDIDEYTARQRAVEDYARSNPKASEAFFILYYLYKTGGYNDVAARQLKKVTELNPNDQLAQQLLSMITPVDPNAAPAKKADSGKKYKKDDLAGSWQTKTGRGTIQMVLNKDGTFKWTYKEGAKTEDMQGIFDVEADNLALQPDSGGTMLAQVNLASEGSLKFKMVGGSDKDPGLTFSKQ